jgi:hypothetical protein
MDTFHYSEWPMRQQFRFASEGQSRSSRLLAERSPVRKHRLCRFGSNAVVMSRAAGSDENEACPSGPIAVTCSCSIAYARSRGQIEGLIV